MVGQYVAVVGKTSIPTDTTVASISGGILGLSHVLTADVRLTDTLTFTTTTLELELSAENAGVVAGQPVKLSVPAFQSALPPQTVVAAVSGAHITLSEPLAADIPGGRELTFKATGGSITFTGVELSSPTVAAIAKVISWGVYFHHVH